MSNEDSLESAAGTGIKLKLEGKDIEIKPFKISDFVSLRKHIKDKKVAEIQSYSEELGAEAKTDLLKEAIRNPVSDMEIEEMMSSSEGIAFLLTGQIRESFPEKSEDDIQSMLASDEVMAELLAVVNALNEGEEDEENPPVGEISS